MRHQFEIEEGDRQMIVCALAFLGIFRPGWKEAVQCIATQLGGMPMLETFYLSARQDLRLYCEASIEDAVTHSKVWKNAKPKLVHLLVSALRNDPVWKKLTEDHLATTQRLVSCNEQLRETLADVAEWMERVALPALGDDSDGGNSLHSLIQHVLEESR